MDDINYILSETFYSVVNPRRRSEIQDSRMIQEDHSAMSNLPQEGYQREFTSRKICRANKKAYFNDQIG